MLGRTLIDCPCGPTHICWVSVSRSEASTTGSCQACCCPGWGPGGPVGNAALWVAIAPRRARVLLLTYSSSRGVPMDALPYVACA